jgi:hypothetical protein
MAGREVVWLSSRRESTEVTHDPLAGGSGAEAPSSGVSAERLNKRRYSSLLSHPGDTKFRTSLSSGCCPRKYCSRVVASVKMARLWARGYGPGRNRTSARGFEVHRSIH